MNFEKQLHTVHGLSDEAVGRVMQYARRMHFSAKQVVQLEGQRTPGAYFVEEGSVRTYVERGERRVILLFAFEGDAVTPDLEPQETARCSIEALESTTLVRIPRERLAELFTLDTELANWARRLAAHALRMHEEYFIQYSWMDKGRQYERMLREYPQLLQRVPLKDLAAYLNVTPQTLSRIRARIR